VSSDLRLEIRDMLLGEGDGVGAGDEPARRGLLAGDRDQRPRELRRVAALSAALCLPPLQLLCGAVGVAALAKSTPMPRPAPVMNQTLLSVLSVTGSP